MQARSPLNKNKSPRLQEGYRTTSKFANFSFNFSLAYKPQKKIVYEIHSMGCELKNFEQTNHEVIVTGDLWVGQAGTDWVYNSGQVPNRYIYFCL